MNGLGDHIRALRKERGLTIVKVAKSSGIDQATLSRIENGKMTGTLDSHRRIALCLGVSLPALYALAGNEDNTKGASAIDRVTIARLKK